MVSCVIQNPKYFSSIEKSQSDYYGYSLNEPVAIKNGPLDRSINSSYYFLSRLRTENGDTLKLIGRESVRNPEYESTGIYNRFSGQQIGGGGPILDKYFLIPKKSSNDTIIIFINPYKKDKIKIPKGLLFENE